jgi:hypothetical protein
MKKRKNVKSISLLPDEILIEIFTYMTMKQIVLRISTLSKEINKLVASKEFYVQYLKGNGLFTPIMSEETKKKYFKTLSSFFLFIFCPMKMTKEFTLKLKQIYSNGFKPNLLKIENLEKHLIEKLTYNIEFPPSCQMFFLLCEHWGVKEFSIEGYGLFSKNDILSNNCDWKEKEFENQSKVPIQYFELASIGILGFESKYFLCLDSNENFGRIVGLFNGMIYVGFSKKLFHEFIRELFEFLDTKIFPMGNDFFHNANWYSFIFNLKFERL